MRTEREIKPLLNQPSGIEWLKTEIKRVNEILRNKPDYHTYKQNKKYLERLERKLRNYGKK